MRRVLVTALAVIVLAGLAPAPAGADEAPPTTPACPAPLPGPRAVVQLAFVVLLRRCPEAGGAATWEASLRDGLATETFARRIAATPEARGVVVADAYRMVLGRPAAASERAFWVGWLRADPHRSRRHDQLLAELAASPEMYAAAGQTDGGFVDLVYRRILGRQAGPSEHDYWAGRMAAGADRRGLARTLLRLPEPLRATVAAAWAEVLDVPPTAAELLWESTRLRGDGDRLGLSARLVGSPAFDARAQARALVVPGRYVALGDSYVVGEGNEPFVPGSGQGARCRYSPAAYPEVARTSSELVPGTLDMAACGGSTLLNLYPFVDTDEGETSPGQIDAIAEGEPPELVTLTIGGNDIGFVAIVSSCLQVVVGGGQLNPSYSREDCDHLLDVAAPAAVRELRTGVGPVTAPDGGGFQCDAPCSLTAAVADVMAAAPDAEVLVVGYPPLMPAADTGCRGPVLLEHEPLRGVEWTIDPRDVRRGRQVIAALNAALRDAAEDAGATYVDPAPLFAGHEVCSADPWIHTLDVDATLLPYSSSFHPNRRGGVGVAAAVVAALEA